MKPVEEPLFTIVQVFENKYLPNNVGNIICWGVAKVSGSINSVEGQVFLIETPLTNPLTPWKDDKKTDMNDNFLSPRC